MFLISFRPAEVKGLPGGKITPERDLGRRRQSREERIWKRLAVRRRGQLAPSYYTQGS